MGSRMARHILDAGHELTVWNRTPGAANELVSAGAHRADSAAAAARGTQLLMTMLATPEAVREVVLDGGLLDEMPAGAVWADSSTVGPAFVRECAAAAAQRGVRFLSTPVAGTREPAAAATLKVLVGGPADVLEDVRPVLESYSAGVIHVGAEIDRGAAFKIIVNGMLAHSMLVYSEALHLGRAMGLGQDFLLKVVPNLPVIAPFVGAKTEMVRSGDYADASFPLELLHKDINLLVEAAYEYGCPLPLAALSRELYGAARAAGRGREDFAAVHAR